MNSFSQNREDLSVLNYFGDYAGTALDIGANSIHLSNSELLMINGWGAVLIEPSPQVFPDLEKLNSHRDNVYCINVAVSDYNGKSKFYDSGTHLKSGDKALLSSLSKEEIKRWGNTTDFDEIEVDVVDFKTLLNLSPYKQFEFISIDAEGEDLKILKQMDLTELNCKCLCIEYNSHEQTLNEIKDYCSQFGLTNVLLKNAENIILSL